MTAPGLGRRPNSDAEWSRRVDERLRRLEQASTSRHGQWVLAEDPVTGKLQALSPDATHDITPDPSLTPDIVAGIRPGVFQAYRSIEVGGNALAGDHMFSDGWYDQVTTSSDRMEYDLDLGELLIQSTAMVHMAVNQRISNGAGNRFWRVSLYRKRLEEDDFTMIRQGSSVRQSDSVTSVVAASWLVETVPGDVFRTGYWVTDSPLGALLGDDEQVLTRWDVARVIDLS